MDMHAEFVTEMQARIEMRKQAALRAFRARSGLMYYSMADACRRSGESPQAMYRVTQRGNTTLKSVSRLATTLGVTVEWLLAGDEEKIQWAKKAESC